MKVRIIKESKLLQEKVEITTQEVKDDPRAYKVIFSIRTGEKSVIKQLLTIRKYSPGTAQQIFNDHLPKVQKCFPKPPEKTYRGDTLDPIHQLQIDYGYVVQQPQYTTNLIGQKVYSHDHNLWILGDQTYLGPDIYTINFRVLEINTPMVRGFIPAEGHQWSSGVFKSIGVSMAFFRKLTEVIGEYIAKNPYRFYHFFGVTEPGESGSLPSKRSNLYNTMLKKMYRELGGDWVQFGELLQGWEDPNSVYFFKCPGGTVTESKKRKYFLTTKEKKLIQEVYNKEIEKFLLENAQRRGKNKK